MSEREYRVELAYRFKRKKNGVLLGMTIKAEDEGDAIDQAIAKHHDYPVFTHRHQR